jgi:O-antigen ligase
MRSLNQNAASLAAIALIGGVAACALITPALIPAALGLLAALLLFAVAYAAPIAATFVWLLVVETTPEMWLSDLIGAHELVIAVLKITGLILVAVTALRYRPRFDRFNPGLAFGAMFIGGFVHGLWPGLGIVASARSLIGSAAPFASGFADVPERWRRAVVRAVIIGPGFTVLFGAVLAAAGVRALYYSELGAVRLSASSDAAFLAGFALTGIYAGIIEFLRAGRNREFGWIALNLLILMATGARAPLFFAVVALIGVVGFIPSPHLPALRRAMLLAAGGAGFAIVLIASSALHFIRVIDLLHLGDAGNLSNRNLVWPVFENAIAASPWLGWGVGAGKVIVPLHSALGTFLGTNAAHEEYLRIAAEGGGVGLALLLLMMGLWVVRGSAALPAAERRAIRLVFIAFALHSATDNTLIATTSLAFFTWARAVLVFDGTLAVNRRRAIRNG